MALNREAEASKRMTKKISKLSTPPYLAPINKADKQLDEMAFEPEIEGNEVLVSLEKKIKKTAELSRAEAQPSIYRVHKQLRDVNEKAYEPEIVAIGPYHRGKDNLIMMEEHKSRYLNALLKRKPDVKLENYISAVAEVERKARNCYVEPTNYISSDEFIEMLVLDGCFIIELLLKHGKKLTNFNDDDDDVDLIFETTWIMCSLRRDLVLFENQIPFFVLSKLFDLIDAPNSLIKHVYLFFWFISPNAEERMTMNNTSHDVNHILDLLHSYWTRPSSYYGDVCIKVQEEEEHTMFIPSATELTYANVKFRRMKSATSLFEIGFHKGIMRMPPLIIEDRTECLLRNLIAHEQYSSYNRVTFYTDYVRLLNCLVMSSKDVEILSQCQIIDNLLGDNEAVVNILSRLTESVAGGPLFLYAETYHRVIAHRRRRWNRMWFHINRKYFTNPWALPSSIVALIVFLLTVVQTVCSILERL